VRGLSFGNGGCRDEMIWKPGPVNTSAQAEQDSSDQLEIPLHRSCHRLTHRPRKRFKQAPQMKIAVLATVGHVSPMALGGLTMDLTAA
jgi:hypothetical protein